MALPFRVAPPPVEPAPEVIDEDTASLVAWRVTCLVRGGSFDTSYAGKLASLPELDYREANALRAAGCKQEQVWDLLRDE